MTKDVIVEGQTLRQNDRVLISWLAANHDEHEFDRARRDRPRPLAQPPSRVRSRAPPLHRIAPGQDDVRGAGRAGCSSACPTTTSTPTRSSSISATQRHRDRDAAHHVLARTRLGVTATVLGAPDDIDVVTGMPLRRPRPGADAARSTGQAAGGHGGAPGSTRWCCRATAHVRYASGADVMNVEVSRNACTNPPSRSCSHERSAPPLHPLPGRCATGPAADHVHGPLLVEFDEGVAAAGGRASRPRRCGRAVDRVRRSQWRGARHAPGRSAPKLTIGDAGSVLAPAKILKTDDEIECIRRAQAINELAMYDVYAALRPGVRQNDLSAIFLRAHLRAGRVGATASTRSGSDGPPRSPTARGRCTATWRSRLNSTDPSSAKAS